MKGVFFALHVFTINRRDRDKSSSKTFIFTCVPLYWHFSTISTHFQCILTPKLWLILWVKIFSHLYSMKKWLEVKNICSEITPRLWTHSVHVTILLQGRKYVNKSFFGVRDRTCGAEILFIGIRHFIYHDNLSRWGGDRGLWIRRGGRSLHVSMCKYLRD